MSDGNEAAPLGPTEGGESEPAAAVARVRAYSPAWVIAPTLFATIGHAGSAALLLAKWSALEAVNGGDIYLGVNGTGEALHTGAPVGPAWTTVVAPAVACELIVCVLTLVALGVGPRPSFNAKLLHGNSVGQALAGVAFKLEVAARFTRESGAWTVVFAPLLLGAAAQVISHYAKRPDVRGRRPGFPLSVVHLLALVVPFKLDGKFHYATTPWASVLWPLWMLGGLTGAALFMVVCCGVPIALRRRGPRRESA